MTPPAALSFPDVTALEAWLETHHADTAGLWIKVAKKASGIPSPTAHEIIDAALCFGWIDGQRRGLNATHYLQRITPRRPRSTWSQVNVRKVEQLTTAGRMRPAGAAEISAAKADGRWDAAYESQREAVTPPELQAALATQPDALRYFESLGKTDRYLAMLPLLKATPARRPAQLTRVVDVLAQGRIPR
ncbi:YdeI/OmpD-associated family protein [Streptomyces boninensis]|uniref:YdeI/OmpD-associated family protein n=1 Tax=Streptomyces boninensis TaxID=2039455 RepID=UPI003B21031B